MDSDDTSDDILSMMVEDFISPSNGYPIISFGSSDNKCWNDGMRIMQKRNFERAAQVFLDSITDECEKMCENLCDEPWRKVCQASNGECLYEKVV